MLPSINLRHTLHHLIRALILGGFAFYIIRLVQNDNLTLYIAPRMTIYVKLAAMGMYVIAAVQLYEAIRAWNGNRDEVSCDCAHPSSGPVWRSAGMYALFVVPLLTAFVTPDTIIGSSMAGKKGINLSASSAFKQQVKEPSPSPAPAEPSTPAPTGLDALFPADQFSESYANYGKKIYGQQEIIVTEKSYMEILTTLDMFLDHFVGKKLTISGFVYRDESTGSDRFILGRFAVQCCTADALPYGVMVVGTEDAQYAKDTWLTITGTLGKTTYNGREIMNLKLEKAVKIKPADDPYVYPDLDFGLN
ncbi:TIGR03943 family protein [Cohnella pontilimi]|uniref:TIGR03943 family protein n=1 Tax=Cohnella pontilimi TaxID=2564100 RepID=A0A4U0F8I0_9BACL|nr:TIGR03943 family protein [Cohnella pontilimi]TJY40748.1 TIGR03943 family protein [Cohnella pontilimi]